MAVEIEINMKIKEAEENILKLQETVAELTKQLDEMTRAQNDSEKATVSATEKLAEAKIKTEELKASVLEETLAQRKAAEERRALAEQERKAAQEASEMRRKQIEEEKKIAQAKKDAMDQEKALLEIMNSLRDDEEKQRKKSAQSVLELIQQQQEEEKKALKERADAEKQAAQAVIDSENAAQAERTASANAHAAAFGKVMVALELAKAGFQLAADAIKAFWDVISGSINDAIKFEAKLAEISTLFQSGFDTAKARKDLLDLSSAFGLDQADVAKGYYDTISAGITDAADAAKVLEAAAKLATGGLTSQATAIEGLTNIIEGYALDISKTAEITDTLFIGAQVGKTTIDELSKSIGQVSPLANAAGVSFQETVAAMSALTLSGKTTAEATTGLRGAIENLLRPNAEMIKALEKAGITSVTASLQTDGLTGVFQKLTKVSGGTTEGLAKIFGSVEGLQAVLSLSGTQAKDYATALKQMGEAAKNAGSVTDGAVSKMQATADFQLKALASSFKNLGTEVFTVLEPGIAKAASILVDYVNQIKVWVRENESLFKEIGARFMEFIDGFKSFATAIQQSETFKFAIEELGKAAKDIWNTLESSAKEVGKAFSDAFGTGSSEIIGFKEVFSLAVKATTENIKAIITILAMYYEGIANIIDLFKSVQTIGKETFTSLWNYVQDNLTAASNLIVYFIEKVSSAFKMLNSVSGVQLFDGVITGLDLAAKGISGFSSTIDRVKIAARDLADSEKKRADESLANQQKLSKEKNALTAAEREELAQTEASKDYYAKAEKVRLAQETEAKNKALADEKKRAEESKAILEQQARDRKKLLEEGWEQQGSTFVKEYGEQIEEVKTKEEDVFKERKERAKDFNQVIAGGAKAVTEEQIKEINRLYNSEEEIYKRRQENVKAFASIISGLKSATDAFDTSGDAKSALEDELKAIEESQKNKEKSVKDIADQELKKQDEIFKKQEKDIETLYEKEKKAIEDAMRLQEALGKDDVNAKKEAAKVAADAQKEKWALEDAQAKDALDKAKADLKAKLDADLASIKAQNDAIRQANKDNKTKNALIDSSAIKAKYKEELAALDKSTKEQDVLLKKRRDEEIDAMLNVTKKRTEAEKLADKEILENRLRDLEDYKNKKLEGVEAERVAYERIQEERIAASKNESNERVNQITAEIAAIDEAAKINEKLANAGSVATSIAAILEKIPGPVGEIGSIVAGLAALVFELPGIMAKIPDMVTGLITAIPLVVTELLKAAPLMITKLIEGIPSWVSAIIEALPMIISQLILLTTDPAFWLKINTALVMSLWDVLLSMPDFFMAIAEGIWQGLKNAFEGVKDFIRSVGNEVWEGLKAGIKAAGDFFANLGKDIWRGLSDGIKGLGTILYDAGKQIWDGFKSVFNIGSLASNAVGGGTAGSIASGVARVGVGILTGGISEIWRSSGGLIPGMASSAGDSRRNDTVPAMLSPGELVIPRSAVSDGMAGIISFARDAIGATSSGIYMQKMASGGFAGSSSLMGAMSFDSVIMEVQALRSDINSIGYALAKNSVLSLDIIDRWNSEGLPQARSY